MEELERLEEPSNAAHFCWQNFKPLVRVTPTPVSFWQEPDPQSPSLVIKRPRVIQPYKLRGAALYAC